MGESRYCNICQVFVPPPPQFEPDPIIVITRGPESEPADTKRICPGCNSQITTFIESITVQPGPGGE